MRPSLNFDPGFRGDWLDVMLHDHPVRAIFGVVFILSGGKGSWRIDDFQHLSEQVGVAVELYDILCHQSESSSMVEHRLPKPVVAGSIPVSRSTISRVFP